MTGKIAAAVNTGNAIGLDAVKLAAMAAHIVGFAATTAAGAFFAANSNNEHVVVVDNDDDDEAEVVTTTTTRFFPFSFFNDTSGDGSTAALFPRNEEEEEEEDALLLLLLLLMMIGLESKEAETIYYLIFISSACKTKKIKHTRHATKLRQQTTSQTTNDNFSKRPRVQQ